MPKRTDIKKILIIGSGPIQRAVPRRGLAGPHDSHYLFRQFVAIMEGERR
jgi:hypothetical protein